MWVPSSGDKVYAVGDDGEIYEVIYNLALHPMRIFPSAKLAAEFALEVIAFREKHQLMIIDPKRDGVMMEYYRQQEE